MKLSVFKKLCSFAFALLMAVGLVPLRTSPAETVAESVPSGKSLETLPQQPKPDFGLTFGDLLGTNAFEHPAVAFAEGNPTATAKQQSLRHMENLSAFGMIREYHFWGWTEHYAGDWNMRGSRSPMLVDHNTHPLVAFEDRINPNWELGNFSNDRFKWGGFERYYRLLSEAGVAVNICMQGSPTHNDSGSKSGNMNWYGDKDPLNPNSYLAYAMSMWQHAARFGSNKEIDLALVRVGPDTEKKVGLGYVRYYENGNEIDHGWGAGHYTPAEFAAKTSACYDGHMNSMIAWIHDSGVGNTVNGQNIGVPTNKPYSGVGVKNADPNAQLVMAGTSGINMAYIYGMTEWFRDNRTKEQFVAIHNAGINNPHSVYYQNTAVDSSIADETAKALGWVQFPIDVLNVHHYCPDANVDICGVAPEDDKHYMGWDGYPLETTMKALMRFRSQYYPNAEIWVSELGWDTQGGRTDCLVRTDDMSYMMPDGTWSGTGIFNVGLTADEVQGRWLARQFLLLAAWGVDRAQQYMMDDTWWGGKFATSGYVTGYGAAGEGPDGWKNGLRPGWFYTKTMKNRIGGTQFERDISPAEHPDMMVLRFGDATPSSNGKAYALWLTTSKGNDAENTRNYTLQLPPEATNATLITMVDKDEDGVESNLDLSGDKTVTVPVNEKPVFVLVKMRGPSTQTDTAYTINFSVLGGNGNVSATADGVRIQSGVAPENGTTVEFTATPAEGFIVKEWKLNGQRIAGRRINTFTIASLRAGVTVTVEFEPPPPLPTGIPKWIPLVNVSGEGRNLNDVVIGFTASGTSNYRSGTMSNPDNVPQTEAMGLIATPQVVATSINDKGRVDTNEFGNVLLRLDKPYVITDIVIGIGSWSPNGRVEIKYAEERIGNRWSAVQNARWKGSFTVDVAATENLHVHTRYSCSTWTVDPVQSILISAENAPRWTSIYVFGYEYIDDSETVTSENRR